MINKEDRTRVFVAKNKRVILVRVLPPPPGGGLGSKGGWGSVPAANKMRFAKLVLISFIFDLNFRVFEDANAGFYIFFMYFNVAQDKLLYLL